MFDPRIPPLCSSWAGIIISSGHLRFSACYKEMLTHKQQGMLERGQETDQTFDNNYLHESPNASPSPAIPSLHPKPSGLSHCPTQPLLVSMSMGVGCVAGRRRQCKLQLSPGISPCNTWARTVQAKPHMALSGVLCSRPLRISKENVTVSPSTFKYPRQEKGGKKRKYI